MAAQRKACDQRIAEAVEHAEYLKDIRIDRLEGEIRILQSEVHERRHSGHFVDHLNMRFNSFNLPVMDREDEPILYRCTKRGCGWMPPVDRDWREMEWRFQSQRDAAAQGAVAVDRMPRPWLQRLRSILPG